MITISLTVTDRQYDGFVIAANGAQVTPEALLTEFVANQGARYANDLKVGIITSAAFMARFTPQEYGDIMNAAATDEEVAGVINQLTSEHAVPFDDPRVQPGLELLVNKGLLDAARPAVILFYERPTPVVQGV